MKHTFLFSCLYIFAFVNLYAQNHYISVKKTENMRAAHKFQFGAAVNPSGETVEIDSESMLWNGKRVVPVMGEIHYSRIPAAGWRTELLKMKAGGINIIATYVFWIHHEEIEGQFDWTGQRDLRRFAETCKELDLKLILRIGPWAHGEVRNGGFPDWLATGGIKLRQNNPEYLVQVEKWYKAVAAQVLEHDGRPSLLWKDGGTVIGIQIENEYRGRWEHLAKLKEIAVGAGFDVPLYTRTGWPALATPAVYGEVIPLYGDYADGFWDRSLSEMPGDYPKAYRFRPFRRSTVIATEQLGQQSEMETREDADYPYFTCELGGGMMTSYHRRINIAPMDIYAPALVKIGSGSNLPGYYMYHGGTNPDGKLTYLNEIQATPMTNYNDLPVKTYDFQAPVGEFGQINEHYHLLRNLHLFLHDFGEGLAAMKPYFPDNDENLRWCVRTDGSSGYVFVNNYERLKNLPEQRNVQFTVDLPNEKLVFPETPVNVPAGASFFFPFNMDLDGIKLKYATAQPIGKNEYQHHILYYFRKIKDIPANFIFENAASLYNVKADEDHPSISSYNTGEAKHIYIILLENNKTPRRHFFNLDDDNDEIVESKVHFSILNYPFEKIKPAGELREITIGIQKVAESPTDKDFENAAVWNIDMKALKQYEKYMQNNDVFMQINYRGDVARLYCGDKLLTDNFFNGKPFVFGINRYAKEIFEKGLTLKILPLQKDAPVYLQVNVDFNGQNSIAEVDNIYIYGTDWKEF